MKKREHLPFFGVGPVICGFQVIVTVIGVVLSSMGYFDFVKIGVLDVPFKIIGTALIILGFHLYLRANFTSELFKNITENKLVTTGVYSIVRNPIYSAFLSACTGAVCIVNNLAMFVIPVICWGFMTITLKLSEEKWLKNLYGDEYVQYCKKVNRCIPRITRKS